MNSDGTMRAAVFAGPNRIEVLDRPVPVLALATDVLVAVEACGICGTDLHILEDPPGHPATPQVVLGHEIVGRIIRAGSETVGVGVGDRVVVSPNLSCRRCRTCKLGLFSACENATTVGIFRDGGLADLVTAPDLACHPISEKVPAKIAALAEPLSCVFNGVYQARPLPGEVAVIYGAGAIGLLFLAVLTAAGVRCVVAEPVALRRAAAARMGAVRAVDPSAVAVGPIIAELGPDGADLAVDAVGNQVVAALRDTRPRGRILLFGMNSRARADIRQNDITRRELVISGTYVGDFAFPAAVRLLESELLDLEPVVSHWLPLENVQQAIDDLRSGVAVKAILDVAGNESRQERT
ncbi:MAG: alcohol dehydrogenase catalytic domain-containing protein [Acidimicrobiales bacterium]